MTSFARGVFQRLNSTLSSSTPDSPGFVKARTATDLFPKPDPAVDGDECLRDCESCSTHYPRTFKIDEDDALYGLVKGWSRHILCATGKTDWVRDVSDEKGSLMEAVGKHDKLVEQGVSILACHGG